MGQMSWMRTVRSLVLPEKYWKVGEMRRSVGVELEHTNGFLVSVEKGLSGIKTFFFLLFAKSSACHP